MIVLLFVPNTPEEVDYCLTQIHYYIAGLTQFDSIRLLSPRFNNEKVIVVTIYNPSKEIFGKNEEDLPQSEELYELLSQYQPLICGKDKKKKRLYSELSQ
jgi:hypothetical protein